MPNDKFGKEIHAPAGAKAGKNPSTKKGLKVDLEPEFGPGEQPITPPPITPPPTRNLPTARSDSDDSDADTDSSPSPVALERKERVQKPEKPQKYKTAFSFSEAHQYMSKVQSKNPRRYKEEVPRVGAAAAVPVAEKENPPFTPHAKAGAVDRKAAEKLEDNASSNKGKALEKNKKSSPRDG